MRDPPDPSDRAATGAVPATKPMAGVKGGVAPREVCGQTVQPDGRPVAGPTAQPREGPAAARMGPRLAGHGVFLAHRGVTASVPPMTMACLRARPGVTRRLDGLRRRRQGGVAHRPAPGGRTQGGRTEVVFRQVLPRLSGTVPAAPASRSGRTDRPGRHSRGGVPTGRTTHGAQVVAVGGDNAGPNPRRAEAWVGNRSRVAGL